MADPVARGEEGRAGPRAWTAAGGGPLSDSDDEHGDQVLPVITACQLGPPRDDGTDGRPA